MALMAPRREHGGAKNDPQKPEHERQHRRTADFAVGIRVVHADGEIERVTTRKRLAELDMDHKPNRVEKRRGRNRGARVYSEARSTGYAPRTSPRTRPMARNVLGLPPLVGTLNGHTVEVPNAPLSFIPPRPRKPRVELLGASVTDTETGERRTAEVRRPWRRPRRINGKRYAHRVVR